MTDYLPGDDRDLEFTGLANCLISRPPSVIDRPGGSSLFELDRLFVCVRNYNHPSSEGAFLITTPEIAPG